MQNSPTDGIPDMASVMAFGYNPYVARGPPTVRLTPLWRPPRKVVAAGARYDRMRYSYQEHFERMIKSIH